MGLVKKCLVHFRKCDNKLCVCYSCKRSLKNGGSCEVICRGCKKEAPSILCEIWLAEFYEKTKKEGIKQCLK